MRYGFRFLTAAAALLALTGAPAIAQDDAAAGPPPHARGHGPGGRAHDPEARLEKLRETLNLTDDQLAQVRTIFDEQREKAEALRGSGDRDAMRALHEETHGRLLAVLDETQRARLEEMKLRHGGGHGARGGEKRGDGEGRAHGERHGEEPGAGQPEPGVEDPGTDG